MLRHQLIKKIKWTVRAMKLQVQELLEDKMLQQAKILTWIHIRLKKSIKLLSFIIHLCPRMDRFYNLELWTVISLFLSTVMSTTQWPTTILKTTIVRQLTLTTCLITWSLWRTCLMWNSPKRIQVKQSLESLTIFLPKTM